MARASIASLGPSARRGARGIARVARQDRDVLSGDRRDRGAKRSGVSRHSGRVSFGSFSLHEQRKGTYRGSATHK